VWLVPRTEARPDSVGENMSVTSKLVAAAALGALTFGLPAVAQAHEAPAQSCHNAKAALAHAKEKKANAKRDLAQANVALKRAARAEDPARVARAEAKTAAALARYAKFTAKVHKANEHRRHNCTAPAAS
jgi:hypothetical protein